MILKAKFVTKENSKEFSDMFMDDTIKCARHIKLGGMWSMENQLLCLSYINAHFIILLLPRCASAYALHVMQTRYCDEISLCLSVRPSVCPSAIRVICDKTVERSVQISKPYERTFSLVF